MNGHATAGKTNVTPKADRTDVRVDLYALLAALLATPPSAQTIRMLAGLTSPPDLPFPLGDALQALKQAADATDARSVNREYNALFMGPGRAELMPYASWYAERLLNGSPLAMLRGDLASLNLKRRDDVPEPEDHASALLECMLLIITETGHADGCQAEFFSTHLQPWLKHFFKDLQDAPSAAFYRSVGGLGVRFLEMEQQLLEGTRSRV